MQSSDTLDNREAEAGAAVLLRARDIYAMKAVENPRHVLRRDSTAVVCYRNLQRSIGTRRFETDMPAGLGVRQRIFDQITQSPLQQSAIDDTREVMGCHDVKLNMSVACRRFVEFTHGFELFPDIHGLAMDLCGRIFGTSEKQQAVDHCRETKVFFE